jgi:hypothetical protein
MNPQDAAAIKSYQPTHKISYDDLAYERERELCERERARANGNGSVTPERYCWCNELVIGGQRYPCPPHHDCQYVGRRNAMIAEASRLATKKVGVEASAYRWTAEFVKAMDRLTAPLLNQSESGGREQNGI